MSTIGSISALNNLSYVQPASNRIQAGGGDSDGDSDGSGGAGRVGQGANFMQAVEQALGQSLGGGTAASGATATASANAPAANQDPVAAVQAFLQSLFAALHQGGNGAGSTAGADRDGDGGSGARQAGSGLATRIQDLLQQITANNSSAAGGQAAAASTPGGATDVLGNLNSSFQDMMNALGAAQGTSASGSNSQTLQSFLQNLMQNLSAGQNISGALVSAQA